MQNNAVGISSSASDSNTHHPHPGSVRLVPERW